jgi:hypothetical protein
MSAASEPFARPELAEILVTTAEDAGFESVWAASTW